MTASTGRANQRRGEATQNDVMGFYVKFGRCSVYKIARPGVAAGKNGRRGTMTTPGTPDFYVVQYEHGLSFWHEAKSGGAKLNPAQKEFKRLTEACGQTVVVGDVDAATEWLIDRGIIERMNFGGYSYLKPPVGWAAV